MKPSSNRDNTISRRFLLLGGIVLILAVLILLTSRNSGNRIFNVETVYDTVFVATDSLSATDSIRVVAHHRTPVPKNPWRGHARSQQAESPRRHPLKSNPENNRVFANMISTLFSPYYYTSLTTGYTSSQSARTTSPAASTQFPATSNTVDLLYETCREDSSYTFGVVCRWFSSCPDDGVEWCGADSLSHYGTSSQYPVFLVLGIGGSPEAPETMYVLRAWTLRSSLTTNFLAKAHRKKPGKKFFFKPDGPWLN